MTKFPDNSLTWVKWQKFPDIFQNSLTWRKFCFSLIFPWCVATCYNSNDPSPQKKHWQYSCPTFGMMSCLIPLVYTSNRFSSQATQAHCSRAHNTNPPAGQETYALCLHQILVGIGSTPPFSAPHLGNRYPSLHNYGQSMESINFDKYNIFPQTKQSHIVCHGESLSAFW